MKIRTKRITNREASKAGSNMTVYSKRVVFLLFCVFLFAGICNYSIRLRQEIRATDAKITANKREIARLRRELENELVKNESLKNRRVIEAKIAQYKLPLVPATPGVENQLVLLSPAQTAQISFEQVRSNRPTQAMVRNQVSKKRK